MAESSSGTDRLQVAQCGDTAYIKVLGRGSHKISASLKDFCSSMINRQVSHIVLDMDECIGMDSTFMGVLAGLTLRLKRELQGTIHMVHLSQRTRELLETLGLDQIIKPSMKGETPEEIEKVLECAGQTREKLETTESSKKEDAEMMLEAHENLIELSDDNIPRFKDVITFLKEDIDRNQPGV